jgi:hypothetical protein
LNKFGVQQLNAKEIVEIEGGNPLFWLLAGVIVSELLDRNAPADFWEGWNDAKQNKK